MNRYLKISPNTVFCSRVIPCIALAIVLLSSCHSDDKAKQTDAGKANPYHLPSPVIINAQLANQFNSTCHEWYKKYLQNTGFNGGLLVAWAGNIIFEKYNGLARLNEKNIIDSTTPFHIASVSKTFTAMAVLKLCQEKKMQLDDAISTYFPALNIPGITIRTLLNHRSGLPNYVHWMDAPGVMSTPISNQDVLNRLIACRDSLAQVIHPNSHFEYCNTNYAILALLIEKLTQMTYADYLKFSIFEPAGMNHSFVYSKKEAEKTIPSYDWRGLEIANGRMDEVYGDKNIYSTPRDLLIWDRLLYSGQYIHDSLMQQAYMPYSHERPGIRNYGLGWRMNIYPDGYKFIYHNGWWHGNNASFIRMLNEKVTIIVLGNKFNRNIYKAKYLASIFNKNLPAPAEDESGD